MRGFTMIELVVAMGVAAMLCAIAVPSINAVMVSERRVAEVNDLVGALNYARSEAVKQNPAAGVSVSASGSWSSGWSACCSAAGATLQTVPGLNSGAKLTASNSSGALTTVTFDGNGAQLSGAGTVLFTFCDSRGATLATAVEVNMLGQIATSAKPGYRVDQTTALACP
jgi:type IV fimbrial biogenesis protein FimT